MITEEELEFGSKTAKQAEREHHAQMNDKGFYAMHPFSLDCEGIWDFNSVEWFTEDSYYEAQMAV